MWESGAEGRGDWPLHFHFGAFVLIFFLFFIFISTFVLNMMTESLDRKRFSPDDGKVIPKSPF